MVCCNLCSINTSTKMQVGNLFPFSYGAFLVFTLRFIYMFIVKEIPFACLCMPQLPNTIVNIIFLVFAWLESCCDLGRVVYTWFQVIGYKVMHIFPVWGISYIPFFCTSMCKMYLSMNCFGINWNTIQIYL